MADKKIIIDFGSGWTKCGFEGESTPSVECLTIVGHPNKQGETKLFYGKEAVARFSTSKLVYPIKNGIVSNWEDMEKFIENTFYYKLRVEPQYHSVFLTETTLNTKENRNKMAEIMFETYDIPSIKIDSQQKLSFDHLSGNNKNGTIVDMGDDSINIVPFVDGKPINDSVVTVDFGGRNLTGYLAALLFQNGYSFSTVADHQIVRQIKEKHSFVELDYEKPVNTKKQSFSYPGSSDIQIDARYLYGCPEPLFRPSLIGFDSSDSLCNSTYSSIMKCDESVRQSLFSNIILTGGSSMFNGIKERLEMEISKINTTGNKVNIICSKDRKHSNWLGASKSITSTDNWVSKEQFSEKGSF
ncbi:hypothetical protein ACTFIU_010374 [Dictyostelium citrinum]